MRGCSATRSFKGLRGTATASVTMSHKVDKSHVSSTPLGTHQNRNIVVLAILEIDMVAVLPERTLTEETLLMLTDLSIFFVKKV